MNTGRVPKFVKQYANVGAILSDAAKAFKADVESGNYPGPEHSYEDN
jgi:3-methyl-2-oxobutanoate hydroxymethyltransferase